jgi:hypothetical protein
MTPEQNLLDLTQREAISPKRFDPRTASPFVNKSVSEETRRGCVAKIAFQLLCLTHVLSTCIVRPIHEP